MSLLCAVLVVAPGLAIGRLGSRKARVDVEIVHRARLLAVVNTGARIVVAQLVRTVGARLAQHKGVLAALAARVDHVGGRAPVRIKGALERTVVEAKVALAPVLNRLCAAHSLVPLINAPTLLHVLPALVDDQVEAHVRPVRWCRRPTVASIDHRLHIVKLDVLGLGDANRSTDLKAVEVFISWWRARSKDKIIVDELVRDIIEAPARERKAHHVLL